MNAKLALALILALQVSVSLCEVPTPSQELVNKYDTLRSTFLKRLSNAYEKIQVAAAPISDKIGEGEKAQAAKEYIEEVQSRPVFQSIVKIATGMGEEARPLVDKARTSLLGLYQHYLRPHIGQQLDENINSIKAILDLYMPAE